MVIAGNFKANLTRGAVREYLDLLKTKIDAKCYVFPSASALQKSESDNIVIGAQNAYPAEHGAFTGETCVEQLAEFGVKAILIGHSERRHVLAEHQDLIAKKFAFFANLGFEIFYCVGEPLEVRRGGFEAVRDYMEAQFVDIDVNYDKLVIAYEPVWAIGTGVTPAMDEIIETHAWLKTNSVAPILYGGSVNGANSEEILGANGVDGVLIGGYSLKAEDFAKVVNLSKKLKESGK